jgi:lipopolysaccharide assembly outer membrane protein LptD (OstA)
LKLFKYIIFNIAVILLTTVGTNAKASANFFFQQQNTQKIDSTKVDKVEYKSRDSTIANRKTEMVHLYGNAKVIYKDFELNADYIRYDKKNDVIFASGITNKNGRYVGRPIFKMDGQGTSIADSIIYHVKTGKGIVFQVFTEQEGGFFSGGQSKVQPDNEVHLKGTTFSTCNLPTPHFGIHISKAIATETQIITGPVYLKLEDIPLPPFFFPFAFFPKPNKKSSGFILPSPSQDPTRGFALNGMGYYQAFNDYLDARLTGNIFTNGSFDATLTSNYIKKYKYNGNINLNFSSQRNGLEGTPEYKPLKSFNIGWSHTQNPMARPGTTFTALVNAGSSQYFESTAANNTFDIDQIARNTMNSSIAYSKVFGEGLFNLTAALAHAQETQTKTISLTLPDVSLNMATINPFDSKDRVRKQRFYEKITMGYSMQAKNTINTKEDVLFTRDALRQFQNGVNHQIPVGLAFNVGPFLNFNANGSYNERWYFQTTRQRLINIANVGDSIARDTVGGFRRAGEYSIGMGVSTKLYYRKLFKKPTLFNITGISHIVTPRLDLSYKPDFSKDSYSYIKKLEYWTDAPLGESKPIKPALDAQGNQRRYTIFDGSYLGSPSSLQQANLNFGIENNVELKVRKKRDTVGGMDKKVPILQGLSLTGNYDFMKPTKKLSNLNFGGRSQFTDKFGINFNGTLSPYLVGERTVNTGTTANPINTIVYEESDRYVFSEGRLPRLTNFSFSTDFSLNPDALKSRNKNMDALKQQQNAQGRTPEQIAELEAISRDPNAFVDFNIPWNIALSYSFTYFNSLGRSETRDVSNTLNFNGDFNLTPKWKIQFRSGYDFKAKDLSYTSFAIYRDLHCWDLNATWVPFGQYGGNYSVTIRVKAAVLQDLKLSKRKGYYTRY